jgi:hypothetical protein
MRVSGTASLSADVAIPCGVRKSLFSSPKKSTVFGRSFKLTQQTDQLGDPEYTLAVRPEGNGKV